MPQGNWGSFEIAMQMIRQLVCLCLSVCLFPCQLTDQIWSELTQEREKSCIDLYALVRTETHIHPFILEISLLDSPERQRKRSGREGEAVEMKLKCWNEIQLQFVRPPKKGKIITKFACNWCQGTSNSKLNHLLYSRAPTNVRIKKSRREGGRKREREREANQSRQTAAACEKCFWNVRHVYVAKSFIEIFKQQQQ